MLSSLIFTRLLTRMIISGGRLGMILPVVLLVLYHPQNYRNTELHVKQWTKPNRNKASILAPHLIILQNWNCNIKAICLWYYYQICNQRVFMFSILPFYTYIRVSFKWIYSFAFIHIFVSTETIELNPNGWRDSYN